MIVLHQYKLVWTGFILLGTTLVFAYNDWIRWFYDQISLFSLLLSTFGVCYDYQGPLLGFPSKPGARPPPHREEMDRKINSNNGNNDTC